MRELLNSQLLEVAAAKIVPAIAGIGFVAMAARYCAAADYGHFSVVFATANLLSVVSVIWISQAVLRYAGSGLGVQWMRGIVAVALVCAGLLSAVGLLLARNGVWSVAAVESDSAVWDVPLLTLALSLNVTVAAFATSLQRFRAYRISEVIRGGMLLILAAAVALWQGGARGLVLAYAAATLVPSALLLVHLDATKIVSAAAPLGKVLRKFLLYGWPMTLWAALQAAQSLMERHVLGSALAPAEFGRFMAVTDVVVRGIGLALMPVVTFVHARLMASAGHGTTLDAGGLKLLLSGGQLIALSGAALTLAVMLARNELARLVPGIAAVNTMTLLLLCVSAILWAIALIVHKPLELARQTIRMGVLLAVAVGIQWAVLARTVSDWREMAMPAAACVAAMLYMAGTLITTRATVRA